MANPQGTKQAHNPKRAQRPRDTHFLCFPLVNQVSVPQLATSLAHFRNVTTLRIDEDDGTSDSQDGTKPTAEKLRIVSPKAFRPPGTYHLTLGVMDLSRQERMDKALALLQNIDLQDILDEALHPKEQGSDANGGSEKHSAPSYGNAIEQPIQEASIDLPSLRRPISPPPASTARVNTAKTPPTTDRTPIMISLTGLATFPSARSARVLYAKPRDPSGVLYDLAVAIRRKFRDAGLITESRPLVLHATVGNLRYAVSRGGSKRHGRGRDEGQIDAREIVKVFDEQAGVVREVSFADDGASAGAKGEFIWAEGIVVDHLAICRLGAVESDDPVLGLEYPPIATRALDSETESKDTS